MAVLPLLVCMLAYGVASHGTSHASKGNLPVFHELKNDKQAAPLRLNLGKAELVDIGARVTDVLVADPNIIDVIAVQSGRLYVVGLSVGDTNIIALDDKGNVLKQMDVHVSYDLKAIQSVVDDVFDQENVKISSVHDQIFLTGTVSNPAAASKISNLVAQYVGDLQNADGTTDELISNLLAVRGEQQVMLQVRMVEAARNLSRDLGFNLSASGGVGGNITNITPGAAIGLDETATTFNLFKNSGINDIGIVDIQLDALEEDGIANILAEPNLTAISGETAGFLAGGEYPVPTGLDRQGNLVVEFKDFGVSLNFKPTVLSKERISLNLSTEVSSLDFDNQVNLGTVDVPGLDIRRAETTVEMPSGGSLMIAGLLQSDSLSGLTGLPGVNKIPVLGKLMSSERFQRNESELIIIVSPYIVAPFESDVQSEGGKENILSRIQKPMAEAFAQNIAQVFDLDEGFNLFKGGSTFGYFLE